MNSARLRWWFDHPLCAPRDRLPTRFWGPEAFNPAAFGELVPLIDPSHELTAIVAALGDVRSVVDVGGGGGLIARTIAERVPVTVIDPSPEQLAGLPETITAIAGRAEALPIGERSCDGALATWVLQYTSDPDRAVDELARIARDRVVIVQAAPTNDLVAIYNAQAAVAGVPPAHHGFLLARAAERLERAGFEVELVAVAIPLAATPTEHLASMLARLHFAGHHRHPAIAAAAQVAICELAGRPLCDDGVVLRASR